MRDRLAFADPLRLAEEREESFFDLETHEAPDRFDAPLRTPAHESRPALAPR